jgi:hypothetical protein
MSKFWPEGTIQDSDFTKGIEYLVQQGVIKVSFYSRTDNNFKTYSKMD